MRLRRAFLSGASVASLVAGIVCAAGTPAAAESVARREATGTQGRNAHAKLIGANVTSTAGGNAGSIVILSNTFTTATSPARGPAVELLSTGGAGGAGDSYGLSWEPGSKGGQGGAISLVQNGALRGKASLTSAASLIRLYSTGGNGGFAQKNVGGGGAGGAVSLTLNADAVTEGANFAAIWARSQGGRSGGGGIAQENKAGQLGGVGGTVSTTISAGTLVSTKGANAPGVILESLGGRGSERGFGTFYSLPYVTDGGAGGTVSFVNRGQIVVDGANSPAVLLQSIGGAGGFQGEAGGQPGGQGGLGGTVTATQWGSIHTKGDYSFGLVAQSVGGTGGKGGDGFWGGGTGGAASAGGTVSVTHYGLISTAGMGASGIVAQSVGGGNALDAFQTGPILAAAASTGGGTGGRGSFLAGGGDGGSGGTGGGVTVSTGGSIYTKGIEAYGILAQSIGGGGGSGANADIYSFGIGIALGGNGGGGGDGGSVTILAAPDLPNDPDFRVGAVPVIQTEGDKASGIVALSVGGGGGTGGTASAKTASAVLSLTVAVGGAGGKGGAGGTVDVTNTSAISTEGVEALGIQAKSIGGGGGNAGNASAYSLTVGPPDLPAVALSFAVGGAGGEGGAGGTVTVTNSESVTTLGRKGSGIEAMSVGGGGGSGGAADTVADLLSLYANVAVNIGVGGSGGGGGSGGAVTVKNVGTISSKGLLTGGIVETQGNFAHAIVAQSNGGGGGDGGTADASAAAGLSWKDKSSSNAAWVPAGFGSVKEGAATIVNGALPLADSFTIQYRIGGWGGKGGAGGVVDVTNSGALLTTGDNSKGIFAQSVGGGGGRGEGFLSGGKGGTSSANLNVGGSGGDGGAGGKVSVTNSGLVETEGAGAVAVFAQSVGGGGGSGGALATKEKSVSKSAGDPSAVKVGSDYVFKFTDTFLKSNDVLSKLLGDPDKKGPTANYTVFDPKGPTQEKMTYAKEVLKGLKALINNDKSAAEFIIQSALNMQIKSLLKSFKDTVKSQYSLVSTKKKEEFLAITVNQIVGGTGGKGGAGGVVSVENSGSIVTLGASSWGVFAQSIGGGGGVAGSATATGDNMWNLNLSVGGMGGDGGAGGAVTVTNDGSIATSGAGAIGLFAQSVGGGGGVGAAATSANTVSFSGDVKLGGSGGKSSAGGTVTVTNTGTITTEGREAHAVVAQSVGGGGGAVLLTRADPGAAGTLAETSDEKEALDALYAILTAAGVMDGGKVQDSPSALIAPGIGFALGGSGVGGGNGGSVTVAHSGAIETQGAGAFGIFAQSVGGGGGLGGDASSAGVINYAVQLGGKGGVAGNGGAVAVTFSGRADITTHGDYATAVFAQSVGGGGGYGGVGVINTVGSVGSPLVVDDKASGNGGAITIGMDATASAAETVTISTSGTRAHGIFAQSLGGGGGMLTDVNGTAFIAPTGGKSRTTVAGAGGDISIALRGDVFATGEGAYAILAQSGVQDTQGALDPTRKGGVITVESDGRLLGGSGSGAAIRVDGGKADLSGANANIITLSKDAVVSALSGTAIQGTFGSEQVTNYGRLFGSVNLVDGYADRGEVNAFTNKGFYQSNAGGLVDVGKAGTFANDGVFALAGQGSIGTTTVRAASFQQGRGGVLAVDVTSTPSAGAPKSDLLAIQGNAVLSGRVDVNVEGGLRPETFRILTATGTLGGGMAAAGAVGAPFVWSVQRNGSNLDLTPDARFEPVRGVGTTDSERSVMRYLQDVWRSGAVDPDFADLFGAFAGLGSAEEYMEGIDSMVPDESSSSLTSQTLNARTSMHASLSCPVFEGSGTLMQETDCAWARIIGTWTQQTSTASISGYDQSAVTYRIGAQREVIDNWFLGATAGFSQSWLNGADGASRTEGNSFDAALSLKHQVGPWLFSLSGHLGYGNYETDRIVDAGDAAFTSQGTANVMTSAGRFRASYEFAHAAWYLRPYVDFDVLYTYMPGYRENGTGPTLDFSSAAQVNFAVSPNLELGGRVDLSPELWLRPYASVGMTFFAKDSMSIDVTFVEASDAIAAFTTQTTIPGTLVNLSAGLQLFDQRGYEVRAEYKADIGDNYLSQELSARFAVQF
ncbi:autotransporter outer membrane beta-barrel domain-containing protein [Aquabacter cavernae]|uniref:autotransporter outer membrane beta-barrel domain-containing protein n=1 Tax=Aquabacter cavernae TaxID=2496029 RepID=UPI000F8D0913|nr:autotransporter outer membrane beta-barrel domain-containing protein [Aquabacter cavernae]